MARTRSLGAANSNNNQNNSAKADSSAKDVENDDKMKSNDVRVTRRSVTNTKDSASPSPTSRVRKPRARKNQPKNVSNKSDENTESAEENITNFIDLVEDDSCSQKQLQLGMDDQFDSNQTDTNCLIEDDQNIMSVIEIVDDQDGILGSYIGSEEIVIEDSSARDFPSSMGEIEISSNAEDEEYSQQYFEYEVVDSNSQDGTVEVEITTDEYNVQPSMEEKVVVTEDEHVEIAVVVEDHAIEPSVPEVLIQNTPEELQVPLQEEESPKKPIRTYGNKRKGKVTANINLDTRIEQVINEVKDIEIDVNKKIVETQLPQQLTEKLSIKDASRESTPTTNTLEPSRRSQRKVIKKYDVKELFARKPKASQNAAKSEKKTEPPTAKSNANKTESLSRKNSSIAHIDLTQIPSLDSGNINNIVFPLPLEIAHDDNSFLRSDVVKRRGRGRKSNKEIAQNLMPSPTVEKTTVITIEDDGDEGDSVKTDCKPTIKTDHEVSLPAEIKQKTLTPISNIKLIKQDPKINMSPELKPKTFNSVQNVVIDTTDTECIIISPEKGKSEDRVEDSKMKHETISPKLKKEVEFFIHTDERPRTPTRASIRKSGKNIPTNLVRETKLITMEKIEKLDYSKKNVIATQVMGKNSSIEPCEPALPQTMSPSNLVAKSDVSGKQNLDENKEKSLVISCKKDKIAIEPAGQNSNTENSDAVVLLTKSFSTLDNSSNLCSKETLDEKKEKLPIAGRKKKEIATEVEQKSSTKVSEPVVSLNTSLSALDISNEVSGEKTLDENKEKSLVRKDEKPPTELENQAGSEETSIPAVSLENKFPSLEKSIETENKEILDKDKENSLVKPEESGFVSLSTPDTKSLEPTNECCTVVSTTEEVNTSAHSITEEESKTPETKTKKKPRATKTKIPRDLANILDINSDCTPQDILEDNKEEISPRRTRSEKRSLNNTPSKDLDKTVSPKQANLINKIEKEEPQIKEPCAAVVEEKDALNELKTEQTIVTCERKDEETSLNKELQEKTLMEQPSICEKITECKVEEVIQQPVAGKDICSEVKVEAVSSPNKSLEDKLKEVLGITAEEGADESHEIKAKVSIGSPDKADFLFAVDHKEKDVEQKEAIKETPKRRKGASKLNKSPSTKQKPDTVVLEKQPIAKEQAIKDNDSEEGRIPKEGSLIDAKNHCLEFDHSVIGSETEICINEVEVVATEEEPKNCSLKETKVSSERVEVSDLDNVKQFEDLEVLVNPDIQSEVECKTENSEDTYDDVEQIPQPQTEEINRATKDEKMPIKEIPKNQTKEKNKKQIKTFSEMLSSIDQMRDLKEKTVRRRSAKTTPAKEKPPAESQPKIHENKNASESDTSSDNAQKLMENKVRRNRRSVKNAAEEGDSSFKDKFFAALASINNAVDTNLITKTDESTNKVQASSSENSKKDEVALQQLEAGEKTKTVTKPRRKSVLPRTTQITRVPTKGMKKMLPESIQNIQLEGFDGSKPFQTASELEMKNIVANEQKIELCTQLEIDKSLNESIERITDTKKENSIGKLTEDSQIQLKIIESQSLTLDSSKQDTQSAEKSALEGGKEILKPLEAPSDSKIETEKFSVDASIVNSVEVLPEKKESVPPIQTKMTKPKATRSPRKRKLPAITTGDNSSPAVSSDDMSGKASNICGEKEEQKSVETEMKVDEGLNSQPKKKRNRKSTKNINENEVTPQNIECKESNMPLKKRRSKKKLWEELPPEPKSEVKKDLTVAELIEIIEKTRSINPISKNIPPALVEESKQNSENCFISSTSNESEEKNKALQKSKSKTEQELETLVHESVDRNFDQIENTILSERKIRSKQAFTVSSKKDNEGLKTKSSFSTNFSRTGSEIEDSAYIQVANDMINEEICQSKSKQSALDSKPFSFKLANDVPCAQTKEVKNCSPVLPGGGLSAQTIVSSEQRIEAKKPDGQYSSENSSQTSSSSDNSNDCKGVKQSAQTSFEANFPDSTKSKPDAKSSIAKNARRKSRNNKRVSFDTQIMSDTSSKCNELSKKIVSSKEFSAEDGHDSQKIETVKVVNQFAECNVSKEPKANEVDLFKKSAGLTTKESQESSSISNEEKKVSPKADFAHSDPKTEVSPKTESSNPVEFDEVAAIEQEFKNLEMQLRCGAIPEITPDTLNSTAIPTSMVPPPVNESNQNEMEKESLQDAENVNIIRRSHRIKTQTKSHNVGRGLVKDKERFGSDSSGKTSEEPGNNNKNNVVLNQIPEMDAMNKAIIEQRMKEFVSIKENEYKCERVISKEAKKMICDCFLTREEEDRGELGCGEDCLNRLLMIECGQKCVVGERCTNRRFQANMYAPCKVFRTEKKGIGVMAEAEVLPGEFIMEYVGEVLNGKQFEKRAKVYSADKNKHYYFMALRSDAIIDATGKGNISRFINHSCDPNAETQKWTVNGELRIGFFCTKRILPGEEITFDYQFQRYGKEAQKCFCESESCRGWIGEEPSSDEEDEDEEEEDEEEVEQDEHAEEKVEPKPLDQKTIPDLLQPLREVMKTDAENKASEEAQNEAKLDSSKLEKENDPTLVSDQKPKPTTDKKVKPKTSKKPKVKKEFRPKKVDLREELDLAKEIASLRASGLKNQAHTLKLSRLMVRAKLIKTRTELLKILYKGEMPCRRLFLDYHGLRLLHGWMIETETADAEEDLEFRLLIAETLEVLPISNKTILKESRVFEIVQNWSKDKMTVSSSPDESPTNNDCNSNSNSAPRSAQSAVASNVAEADDYHPVKCEIIRISTKLIALWENLPEVFRIPKKERIEQMKEHEREADRQFKALSLADDTETSQARNKERFGLNKTNKIFKPKKIRTENNNDLPKINPDLSKDERRKLFAEHVAKSMALKKEMEMRRTFEAKCKFFGFDPLKLNPADMPVSYGKQTGQWYAANQRKIQTPPSQLHIPVQIRPKSTNPDDYILPPMDLPPYWKFAIDKRGRIYYYHVQVRVPQWEPPSKTSQAGKGPEESIIRKEVTTQTKCESSDSDSSDTDLSSEWEGVINEENDNDSVTREKVMQMRHGRRKKRQDLLVQKRTISPRREEDRLYNQSEMKRYRENKEKIRKRKEEIKRRKLQILMKQQEGSLNSPLAEETLRNIAAQVPITAPLPIQDFLISSDEDDVKIECDTSLIDKFVQGDKIVDELDALNKERSMKLKQTIKLKGDHKKRVKVGLEKRKLDGITTTSSADIMSSSINNSIKISTPNLSVNSNKSIKRRKTDVESGTSSSNLSVSLKHQFRRAKEKFRNDIAGIIVHHLTPYRKDTCTVGKITNIEDFKHLARKLTHFVMIKELKHCGSTGHSLVVTESVKNKSREFIKKYMTKYGRTYVRPENDPEFREI